MNRTTLAIGIALALVAGGALAHSGVKNATVLARMELMKDMGRQMKVLGRMDKGFINFDAGAVQVAVARIAVLAEKTPTLFEAPAQDPNSEALPVIWDDFSTFAQEAQALEMVTARLTIVQQIDLHPALKQLGAACKSCHGRFRK